MEIKIKRKIKQNDQISDEEIINLLLFDRGIKNKKEFLNPPHPKSISLKDFFPQKTYQRNIEKTINKLKKIKEDDETVVVYTDYDADGVTGGAILWETLHLLGFNAFPYVPHRKKEGYGFSKKGIEAVKKKFNPALIISVDHGIAAKDEISYAKSLNIAIIVTDHHLKPAKTSTDALAVFHTSKLSGAGLAYFFAKQLFEIFSGKAKKRSPNYELLITNFERDYPSLASIGTVADLVPLVGPSRSLVKHGLAAFSKTKRMGLREILKEAGIEEREITPNEIGFIIAPRINAFGRLEHALDALRLLCTSKNKRAFKLAQKAGETNKQRQKMVEEAVLEAKDLVKDEAKIIVLYSKKWHEGIIGLVASKLVEEFYRPAVVISLGDGFGKASARSISGFDITSFLRSLKKYLVDVGGHKAAAGFTIKKSKISQFAKIAKEKADKLLKKKDLVKKIKVDLSISLSYATLSLAKKIEKLSPFGVGNPRPVFYSQGEILAAELFGKDKDHLKVYLKDESVKFPLEIVFFGQGEKFYNLSRSYPVEVVYSLGINRWGGREKIRGKGSYLKT